MGMHVSMAIAVLAMAGSGVWPSGLAVSFAQERAAAHQIWTGALPNNTHGPPGAARTRSHHGHIRLYRS
jgi:hypothetical protein